MIPEATTSRTRPTAIDQRYWTAWVATLLFFAAFYTLLVPLPRYLVAAGLPDWQIGLVLGAFGIASLIGRPLTGLAADRWGPRRVLLAGALALLVGAVGVPLVASFAPLFVLRLCQAGGYVAFTTAGTALIIRLTPLAVRGQRLAIFGAAANVAITLVPAITSTALANAPLATGFLVAGLLACVAGGLALRLQAPPAPPTPAAQAGLPLRRLALPMLTAALLGAGFAAFFQFAPLLSERRGGLPAGVLYTCYGLGIIAARLTTGRLLDHWAIGRTVTLAGILLTAGLALLAVGVPPAGEVLATLLIAFGSGISHPALLAHHATLLPEAPGQASAAFYLGFDLGIGVGSVLFGFALQLAGLAGLYSLGALLVLATLPMAPLLVKHT